MEKYYHSREKLDKSQKNQIIGDISGLYGIEGIDSFFLYMLSLRSILWGGDPSREIILPNASNDIQSKLSLIKDGLANILSIPLENIRIGDFRKITFPGERETYMKTPYYFDQNYIKKNIDILKLVRNLGDKVYLANFIQQNGLSYLLPDNTRVFMLGDNFDSLVKEALFRFKERKNFIIKSGEGASGENMILVFFDNDKIYLAYSKLNGKKEIQTEKEFLEHINLAISTSQRYKKGLCNINGYDENAISEQYFLIQNLVDTKEYEEKSINFFIDNNGFYPTTFGKNLAVGGVHIGNIEEELSKSVLEKITPLLEKIKQKGYYGPIGFDFFYNNQNQDIRIIEANTRYTAPLTPSMLVYKLQKQGKIPLSYTWQLVQKFPTFVDLLDMEKLGSYNLLNSILKEEDIKEAKFLVYSPVLNNKYQSIIIIGPNQEEIKNLYNKIAFTIKNK